MTTRTIEGTPGDDDLSDGTRAYDGDVTVVRLMGLDGADTLTAAGSVRFEVHGGAGDDRLIAASAFYPDDGDGPPRPSGTLLSGGAGDDTLEARASFDGRYHSDGRLADGPGLTMTGGVGADLFLLGSGYLTRITDFGDGDTARLTGAGRETPVFAARGDALGLNVAEGAPRPYPNPGADGATGLLLDGLDAPPAWFRVPTAAPQSTNPAAFDLVLWSGLTDGRAAFEGRRVYVADADGLTYEGHAPALLTATHGTDLVRLGDGDDVASGRGGGDRLEGGAGGDALFGDGGADTLMGGAGADSLFGGQGPDRLLGGDGDDRIEGGAGDDTMGGGAGRDTLLGGEGDDVLTLFGGGSAEGGAGADRLLANELAIALFGGDDADEAYGGRGDDTVNGGAGSDTLFGDDGDDFLRGDDGARRTGLGDPGSGRPRQPDGADFMDGGSGDDTLVGEGGADLLRGGAGDDVLTGDHTFQDYGADRFEDLSLRSDGAADTLEGGAGDDTLYAFEGDVASGGTGDDVLIGSLGADSLTGGAGDDVLYGDGGPG